MTSSSLTKDKCFHEESSQLIGVTPKISSDCPTINFSDMWNICFIVRLFPVFLMECKFSEYSFPMNTDASNVEDINIPQIKERLSMSFFASFEDWSNIFRTRSFTLCKNDRDYNERFESVTVLESISSSSAINLSVCCVNEPADRSFTGLPVLASNISPDVHSWEDHFSSIYSILSSLVS